MAGMIAAVARLLAAGLLSAAGAAAAADATAGVAMHTNTARDCSPPAQQEMAPMAEVDLKSDDPALSARARQLIRIGERGIATEDAEAVAAFFHPDFRFHGPNGGTLTREALWGIFAAYRAAFDDFKVTRQQIFSDGGANVAARTTFSGVFAHALTLPPVGRIVPHGRAFSYTINNVFRYAPDGRLIEEWAQYDSRLLLESLGVELVPKR